MTLQVGNSPDMIFGHFLNLNRHSVGITKYGEI